MKLQPVVASYTGESFAAIMNFLDDRALEVVARVARSPVPLAELDDMLVAELTEMHVLRVGDCFARLDTAVFLEPDIRMINGAVLQLAKELTPLVMEAAAPMRAEPPVVKNFIVGMMGVQQSLGRMFRETGIAVDWRSYGGKYASAKVDFDEVCEARTLLGADLQSKNVLRGTQYTAVLIGPDGGRSPLRPGDVDIHALRLATEQAAGAALLTDEQVEQYLPVLRAVSQVTGTFFAARVESMGEWLRATTAGRQSVPPANMMMHLWRYVRRGIAREFYAQGLLTDSVPEIGMITVFYRSDMRMLAELLG